MSEDCSDSSTEAAERGTRLHLLMANGGKPDSTLTDYDVDLLDRARKWRGYFETQCSSDDTWCEAELGPLKINGLPESLHPFGTVDWLGYKPGEGLKEAIILDYKFGPLELDQEFVSLQMLGYAALLFHDDGPEKINCYVYHAASGETFEVSFHRNDYPSMVAKYREIIMAAEQSQVVLSPSERTCLRCPGSLRCPAVWQMAEDTVELFPRLTQLSPIVLGTLLDKAKVLSDWAERFRSFCGEMLTLDPAAVSGWKLQSRSNRRLRSALSAWMLLRERIGIEAFLECCSPTNSKLRAEFVRAECVAKGCSQEEAEATYERLIGPLMVEGERIQFPVVDKKARLNVRDNRVGGARRGKDGDLGQPVEAGRAADPSQETAVAAPKLISGGTGE